MRAPLRVQVIVMLCVMTGSTVAQQQQVVESLRQQQKQYLTELIEAIVENIGLTELQLRRLRVASKGAVEYTWQLGWRADVAARHPIWTKTLERMLTAEQLKQVKSLEKQQRARWKQRDAPQPRAGMWLEPGQPLNLFDAIRPRQVVPIIPREAPADRPQWNHLAAQYPL